jgi:hypothetical protein
MYAGSEDDYNQKWNLLSMQYGADSVIIKYLSETWIVHKDLFVACYINNFMHLGSHKTSRVEGAHHTLKGYLDNSLGNLKVVKDRIELALKSQLHNLSAQVASEKVKVPHYLDTDFLRSLSRKKFKPCIENNKERI